MALSAGGQARATEPAKPWLPKIRRWPESGEAASQRWRWRRLPLAALAARATLAARARALAWRTLPGWCLAKRRTLSLTQSRLRVPALAAAPARGARRSVRAPARSPSTVSRRNRPAPAARAPSATCRLDRASSATRSHPACDAPTGRSRARFPPARRYPIAPRRLVAFLPTVGRARRGSMNRR